MHVQTYSHMDICTEYASAYWASSLYVYSSKLSFAKASFIKQFSTPPCNHVLPQRTALVASYCAIPIQPCRSSDDQLPQANMYPPAHQRIADGEVMGAIYDRIICGIVLPHNFLPLR